MDEGPTCCTWKPYWGAAKKACDIDQCGAPPMDGSNEDDQAGAPEPAPAVGPTCYTGKPYWGAAKKARGIDQYGLKDGQAGAPVTAAAAKGPAALTPAANKGRPAGGWGRVAAVPAGASGATTAPMTR
jgi:hypothetical protein